MVTNKNVTRQFTASGHIIGSQPNGVYIASTTHALHIEFVNANPVQPQSTMPPSTSGQATALDQVTWQNLWKGVTLSYRASADGIVESVYTIDAGAAVEQIRLRYNAPVAQNADGSLKLTYPTGQMIESAPIAWQVIDGVRVPVSVAFQIRKVSTQTSEIGFVFGKYDHAYPVTIDPTLTWNSFFGAGGSHEAKAIAFDPNGNVFVVGSSSGTWGSPVRSFSPTGSDAYVAKLDATGALIWNSFLGTAGSDFGKSVGVDLDGNVFVIGKSLNTWGTPNRPFSSGSDVFVAKLNSNGVLQWNTFLGGVSDEDGDSIVLDLNGNIHLVGVSAASWGTPVRPFSSGYDAFVAQLNSSGTLQWTCGDWRRHQHRIVGSSVHQR
ncbi:MAG: SBBP repeat-containing protein [Chloroflexi bacterium]|nr:SBBP repeat-containing protein [Chloroflexota bacterium]